jgi:hypothetical protein
MLNKKIYSVFYALPITLLLLAGGTSLVFASPIRTTLSRGSVGNSWQHIGRGKPDLHHQENNQVFRGVSNNSGNATFVGTDQGNSGNLGLNNGLDQVNTANAGNQVVSQHKNIEVQNNDQSLRRTNNGGGNTTLIGTNQGNSGNQGTNNGFNQDNAGNQGNQVNNQGNIIGVQINKQGTQVNNNGNLILHQINNISLLPPIHLHFALLPKPQLSLSTGEN